MKIYIIGCPGAGKTTLSKMISEKYNIPRYELDKIVYDDENEHIKRTDDEIKELFNEIISNKSWIIEDVGREIFDKGKELADIIYCISLPKRELYKRVIKRWIKQRLGKEDYNYPPTFWQFFNMIKIVYKHQNIEKNKLGSIEKYKEKIIFLDKKKLNKLENELFEHQIFAKNDWIKNSCETCEKYLKK